MVKKNYVAPAANEARTKLRTGLLAGSGFGQGGSSLTDNGETAPGVSGDKKDGGFARERAASSLD